MVAPSIKPRMIPDPGIVAVVAMAAVVVAAIHSRPVAAVVIVSARIIGVPAPHHVGALHVSAIRSHVYDPHSVVHTHNRPAAVDSMLNVHPVPVDRTNLSIGTDARISPASKSNR